MRRIAVGLSSLLLAGCASTVTRIEIVHAQINCQPIPYPRALVLAEPHPENEGDYWKFSHADYLVLRDWVIEIDRYLSDVRAMTVYLQTCMDSFNSEMKKADEPPPKKWWQKIF